MKTRFIISFTLSLFIAFSFNSCDSTQGANNSGTTGCVATMTFPEDHGQAQKHSLVFIDLTDASIYGEEAKNYLQKIMEQRLSTSEDLRPASPQKADKMQVFFITANTATTQSISPMNLELRTGPLGNLIEGQTIINSSKKARYTCELQEFIHESLSVVDAKIKKAQAQNKDVNSDVLGLFYVADREFKRSKAEDKAIFVISDMEQFCQNGGYFKCQKTRICSSGCNSVYAEGNAAEDARSIQQKLGSGAGFKGASFHYIRGDREVSNTNQGVLNFIQDYWAGLGSDLQLNAYTKL